MSWQVHIAKSAKKNLKHFLQKYQDHILLALRELAVNPYAGDIEKIGGEQNTWRRRVGSYRILYEINVASKLISVRTIDRQTSNTY